MTSTAPRAVGLQRPRLRSGLDPLDPLDPLVTSAITSPVEPRTDGRVVVVGDVLDDIIVALDRRPAVGTDTDATIRHRAGGSAANTAAWLASQGVGVDFVGRVGSSDLHRHSLLLQNAGVTPRLLHDPLEPTGTVVITVAGTTRTMLTDRGASAGLELASLDGALFDGAAIVHLTGYSIVQDPTPDAFQHLVARVRAAGALLSVDPASSGFVSSFGPAAFLDLVDGADLFFPSLDEGALLTGRDDPDAIVQELLPRFGAVALTLPDGGAVAGRRGGKLVHAAPSTVRLVDPVGTGDAFSAGFLAAWLKSPSLALSVRRGTKLAARARAVVGGRPAR
ncbi:carbohydrate kinase family protein [Frondihabitans australicus]|uniref:Sugar/nucleoside kinase (Ribokinase family) n=1 Tax=Frondihabitans australicus TaxID=386892 RepID=A0A495ID57_9MICO|nr:PfkB family carbohydrate kinase [Frondihabitans australicus]RKR73035.1 sugar/nucleoside kinase (ribokinase family) [Frondihabitans australicus]